MKEDIYNDGYVFDRQDFDEIISRAKGNFINFPTKVYMNDKRMHTEELRNLAIAQATISRLIQLGILEKRVRFHYEKEGRE